MEVRQGYFNALVIFLLFASIGGMAFSVTECSRNKAAHQANVTDIETLAARVDLLFSDSTQIERLDSLADIVQVNRAQTNAIMFDINRALTYIANEQGMEIDSVWAFVNKERAKKNQPKKE